jgi:hypothetical protein
MDRERLEFHYWLFLAGETFGGVSSFRKIEELFPGVGKVLIEFENLVDGENLKLESFEVARRKYYSWIDSRVVERNDGLYLPEIDSIFYFMNSMYDSAAEWGFVGGISPELVQGNSEHVVLQVGAESTQDQPEERSFLGHLWSWIVDRTGF